jgi:hypothetical protein
MSDQKRKIKTFRIRDFEATDGTTDTFYEYFVR